MAKIKLSRGKTLFLGGMLIGISLVLSFLQAAYFSSDVMLSPGDSFSSKVSSLPETSFLVLILAAVAVVILGIAGVIFLIVGLSEK